MRKSSVVTIVGLVASTVPAWSVALIQHRLPASQEPVEVESQVESAGTQKALDFGKDYFSKVLHETAKYGTDPTLITALENITEAQLALIPKVSEAKAKMQVLKKLVFGDADLPATAEGSVQQLIKELTSQLQAARAELKELQVKVSRGASGAGRQTQLQLVEDLLSQTMKTIRSRGKQQWEALQPESRALLNKMKSTKNATDIEHIKDQMRASADRQRIEVLHGCRLASDHLSELIAVVEKVKKQPRDVRLASALEKQKEAVRLMDEALANTTTKLEEMHKTALKRGDPKLVRDFQTAEYEFHLLNDTVHKQEVEARKALSRLMNETEAAIRKDRKLAVAHSAEQAWDLKESINALVAGHEVNRTVWESKLNELKDLMVPTESELKSTQKQIKAKAEALEKLWQRGGTVYDWALGAQKMWRPILQRLNENGTRTQAKAPKAPKPEVEAPKAEAPVAEMPESQAEEVSPEVKEAQPPAEAPVAEAEEVSAQPAAGPGALETEAPKAEAADAQAEQTETPAEAAVAEVPESQAEQVTPPAEAPVAEVPESQATEASSQAEEAKTEAEAPAADAPESQAEEVSPEAKASQAEAATSEAEEAKTEAEAPAAEAPEPQAEEVSPETKASQAEAATSEAEEAKTEAEAPAAEAPEPQAEEVSPEAKASQAEAASSEAEEVNTQPAEVPEDQAPPADSQAEEVSQAGEAEVPAPQAEEASAPQAEEAPASAEEAPASAEEAPASQAEEAPASAEEAPASQAEEGGEAPQE